MKTLQVHLLCAFDIPFQFGYSIATLRYEIQFTHTAAQDLLALRAADRAKITDAIETHLRYEPEKVSKSRIKRLRHLLSPQYRLRVDEHRVFYDVE